MSISVGILQFPIFPIFWNGQCHSKYRDECNLQFQNSLMVINGTVIDLITEDKFHFNEATVDLALLCKWISESSNYGCCIAHQSFNIERQLSGHFKSGWKSEWEQVLDDIFTRWWGITRLKWINTHTRKTGKHKSTRKYESSYETMPNSDNKKVY